MTLILNNESSIKRLDLSSYMTVPINEEQFENQIESIFQNKNKDQLKLKDTNYMNYYDDCARKIESFLKYNSIVDMSFHNNKMFFEDWKYKQRVETYLKNSRVNQITILLRITLLII